jgi:hypothetical protein
MTSKRFNAKYGKWLNRLDSICPACREVFGGNVAGDMHRVGEWTDVSPRRCLTAVEMAGRGLRQSDDGVWHQARVPSIRDAA